MASASCPMPFLPLSPLVGGPALSEDFFATLVAQGVLKPLPTLSFTSSSRPRKAFMAATCSRLPSPLTQDHNISLPAPAPPIPPRHIISLLDLLERIDNDLVKEVQRIHESIKETRTEIAEYRTQRNAQDKQIQKRKARERRETVGIDDEFWLQV